MAPPYAADPGAAAALQHVHGVVSRSGSSFTMGMRFLARPRREAMYAIYAFCREVDDIADEPASPESKLRRLGDWRREIDRLFNGVPTLPTSRALLGPVGTYGLPKEEFVALIDGMEMDAGGTMVAPEWDDFQLYCRRVAGAVGLLSIRAFGAQEAEAEEIAVVLGMALQITNILRDLDEDAANGRLYLPRPLLREAGIPVQGPAEILAHPALPQVCEDLVRRARQHFDHTRTLIARCDRRRIRPCILMMEVYVRILDRLERRGWSPPRRPVKVSRRAKLWIAMRHGLF